MNKVLFIGDIITFRNKDGKILQDEIIDIKRIRKIRRVSRTYILKQNEPIKFNQIKL